MAIKSKETRVVSYICRYFSGNLIPTIEACLNELGITLVPYFFIPMISIDYKITNFSLLTIELRYTCFE